MIEVNRKLYLGEGSAIKGDDFGRVQRMIGDVLVFLLNISNLNAKCN